MRSAVLNRGVLVVALVMAVATVGLAGCADDDSGQDDVPPGAQLPDPCRLLGATQQGRDLSVKYALDQVEVAVEADETPNEAACSWIAADAEDQSADYLERDTPRFIDMVIRRSDPAGDFDAGALFDEMASDPEATERPELLASEADRGLADEAVSVGASLFVLKADVVFMVSTDSPETLEELIPEITGRIVRRV